MRVRLGKCLSPNSAVDTLYRFLVAYFSMTAFTMYGRKAENSMPSSSVMIRVEAKPGPRK